MGPASDAIAPQSWRPIWFASAGWCEIYCSYRCRKGYGLTPFRLPKGAARQPKTIKSSIGNPCLCSISGHLLICSPLNRLDLGCFYFIHHFLRHYPVACFRLTLNTTTPAGHIRVWSSRHPSRIRNQQSRARLIADRSWVALSTIIIEPLVALLSRPNRANRLLFSFIRLLHRRLGQFHRAGLLFDDRFNSRLPNYPI